MRYIGSGRNRLVLGLSLSSSSLKRAGESIANRGALRFAVIAAALLAAAVLIGAILIVWSQIASNGRTLGIGPLVLAVIAATGSYSLRLLRWHVLVRGVLPTVPLLASLSIQSAGFALSASPARLGEVLKLWFLERDQGLPVARTAPVIVLERLSDVFGLGFVAVVGGLFSTGLTFAGNGWIVCLSVLAAVAALGAVSVMTADRVHLGADHPGKVAEIGAEFIRGNVSLIRGIAVPSALALTIVARLFDAASFYFVSESVGISLSKAQAALALGAGGLAGGISLLPAGLVTAEGGMLAVLTASGTRLSEGITVVLVARIFTYWIWVTLGLFLLMLFWDRFVGEGLSANNTGINTPTGT